MGDKNPSELWLDFIECYALLNTLHYFTQIKEKIFMTIFHRLQGFLVIYFNFITFLFTLAKFDIYLYVTVILQIVIQI